MNIEDLFDKNEKKKELGYDLADDLKVFMLNDPDFYRKKYFPAMLKYNKFCKQGKSITPRGFTNLVKEAYEVYRNKFQQVEGLENELDEKICEEVCKDLHELETKNCKEGIYDEN